MEPLDIVPDIAGLKPSATLSVAARAADLRAQGHDVLDLSAGEPDFLPPSPVREAVARLVTDHRIGYAPVPGLPALREAVAGQLSAYHGVPFTRENVLVSCGAKHSLANLFRVTLRTTDEVVVLAPYWSSYPEMVQLMGAKPVIVHGQGDQRWRVPLDRLEMALGPQTRYVIVNSPCNPTGMGLSETNLRQLGEVVARAAPRAWIIVDDIYRRIVYDDFHHVSAFRAMDGVLDRIIVIDGVSKSHAMTGFRIGFLAGPVEVVRAANKVQGQMTSGAATPSQHAALVALTDPQCEDAVEAMRSTLARRREALLSQLANIPGLAVNRPDGAFYVFVDAKTYCGAGRPLADDVALATWLLEQKNVAVVPGTAFGAPGYLRLSYAAADAVLDEALTRLRAALATLA